MRGGSNNQGVRGSRLGWVLRFGAGALVAMVGANVLVIVASRRLPDPIRYYSPRTEQLVGEMDRLQDAGVRSDLVFAGTSQAARGIVPKVVGPALGMDWTGNVAIPGSQAPITKRWLLEEVEPRLRPRHVVWGISSIDFNGKRPDPGLPRYDAALATRSGLLGDADEIFSDNVPVARHRSQLRDPYKLGSELSKDQPAEPKDKPLHDLLGPVLRAPASEQGKYTELLYLQQTLLGNFKVTDDYLAAYRDTLKDLHRRGIETAVVIMPVSSHYQPAHPGGVAQYEAWKRPAVKTAKDAGVKVIDLDTSMPDDAFSDYVHLKPDAARTWSATLAQRLAALGWSEKAP